MSRHRFELFNVAQSLSLALYFGVVHPISIQPVEGQEVEKLSALGIRTLVGKHITIFTDARDRADVEALHHVFDLAVPQWCDFFDIDLEQAANWHVRACVIVDRQKFAKAELFPYSLPPFPAGYQRKDSVWLYVQDGDYYTRHLLLHEGTHAFMQRFLGDYGPPWYAEGVAEWIAVHRWNAGRLELRAQITDRNEVPYWGRVKLLREDTQQGRMRSLVEVMKTPNASFRQVNSYAWAWAACEFLGRHPKYVEAFNLMADSLGLPDSEFNARLYDRIGSRAWTEAEFQWQVMLDEMDYGYDVARAEPSAAIVDSAENGATIEIAVDRGWQSTGMTVDPDHEYQLESIGKFVVRQDPQPWECTGQGVTISYYRGLPLGRLLAGVRDPAAPKTPFKVADIGGKQKVRFSNGGELYLRINESPAQWADNEGSLKILISKVSD